MTSIDVAIVALYAVLLFGFAQWVSRDNGQDKTTEDYFLAGRTLPWWAIGASLIAANISAEQIIGQSGQGFVVGLAIAAREAGVALVARRRRDRRRCRRDRCAAGGRGICRRIAGLELALLSYHQ